MSIHFPPTFTISCTYLKHVNANVVGYENNNIYSVLIKTDNYGGKNVKIFDHSLPQQQKMRKIKSNKYKKDETRNDNL